MTTTLTNVTVLIADDYPLNLMILNQILTSEGATVISAENGRVVLQKLALTPVDVILMDLQMEEMDGFEAAQAIRFSEQPYSNIPIIALTGESNPAEIEKSLLAGMDDFLFKPVVPAALFKKILELLEKRKIVAAFVPAEINQTAAFDLNYLLEITRGKKEKIREIVENLEENGPSLLSKTELALLENNGQLASAHLHQLKGLIGIFYMKNMINTIVALERELKLTTPDYQFVLSQLKDSHTGMNNNIDEIKRAVLQ